MTHKIPVGGMRVSPALVQLDVAGGPDAAALVSTYAGRLAEHRINLPFATLSSPRDDTVASLCVEAADGDRARELALGIPELPSRIRALSPVAALSVFPHDQQLRLLYRLLEALHRARVPLLALGSSIAALTLTLVHRSLEPALDVLAGVLELPPNHTPWRTPLQVIQVDREEEP